MAEAAEIASKARRSEIRNRWLLSTPALLVILLAATGPRRQPELREHVLRIRLQLLDEGSQQAGGRTGAPGHQLRGRRLERGGELVRELAPREGERLRPVAAAQPEQLPAGRLAEHGSTGLVVVHVAQRPPLRRRLAHEGRLHGAPLGGFWMHVGDPQAREEAEARLANAA